MSSKKIPPSGTIPLRQSSSSRSRAASPLARSTQPSKIKNPPMIFNSGGSLSSGVATTTSPSPYRRRESGSTSLAASSSPNYARPTINSSRSTTDQTPNRSVVKTTYTPKGTLDATAKMHTPTVSGSELNDSTSTQTSIASSSLAGKMSVTSAPPPTTVVELRASIVSSRSSTPVSKNRTPSSQSNNSGVTHRGHTSRLPTPNENRQRSDSAARSRSPAAAPQARRGGGRRKPSRLPKELRTSLEVESITRVGSFPLTLSGSNMEDLKRPSEEHLVSIDGSLREVFAASAEFVWCLSKSCISLIDTHTRKVEAMVQHDSAKTFGFYSCATPVDNTVWVGTTEGHIHVLDKLTLQPTAEPMVRHHGAVNHLIHQQPASAVFSSGVDFTILKWSTDTLLVERCFVGHHGSIRFIALLDGGWGNLVSYADDSHLRCWSTALTESDSSSTNNDPHPSFETIFSKKLPSVTALATFKDTQLWYGTREGEVFVISPISEETVPRRVFHAESSISSITTIRDSIWVQESIGGKITVMKGGSDEKESQPLLEYESSSAHLNLCNVHTTTLDIVWLVDTDHVEELTLSSAPPLEETMSQINATKHIFKKCAVLEEANDEMQRGHIDLKEQVQSLKLDNDRLRKIISERSGDDVHQQIIKDLETSRAKAVKACESSAKNIKSLREKERECLELELKCAEQDLLISKLKSELQQANAKRIQGDEELKGVTLAHETLRQELFNMQQQSHHNHDDRVSESPAPQEPPKSTMSLAQVSDRYQEDSASIEALRREVLSLNSALEKASEELAQERIRVQQQHSELRDSHVEGAEVGQFLAGVDAQMFVAHQSLQKAAFGIGKAGPGGYRKSVESAFLSLGVIRDSMKRFSSQQPAIVRYLGATGVSPQQNNIEQQDEEMGNESVLEEAPSCDLRSDVASSSQQFQGMADLTTSRPAKRPTDVGFQSKWRQERTEPDFQAPRASEYFVQSSVSSLANLRETSRKDDDPRSDHCILVTGGDSGNLPTEPTNRATLPVVQEGDSSPAAPLHEPQGDAPSETVSVVVEQRSGSESSLTPNRPATMHLDPEYLRQEY